MKVPFNHEEFKDGQEVKYAAGVPWKKCTQCNGVKTLIHFAAQGKASSGHRSYCKLCDANRDRKPKGKIVNRKQGDLFDKELNSIPKVTAFVNAQHVIQNNIGSWKKCARCNEVKLTKYFESSKEETSGYRSWCSECDSTVFGKPIVESSVVVKASESIIVGSIEKTMADMVGKFNALLQSIGSKLKFKTGE